MGNNDSNSIQSGKDAFWEYGTDLGLAVSAGVLAIVGMPIAASVAAIGAMGLGATLVLDKALEVYSAQSSKFSAQNQNDPNDLKSAITAPSADSLSSPDSSESSDGDPASPVATPNPSLANKKALSQQVADTQHAATQIEHISANATKAKAKDDKTWLNGFLNDNQLAEKTGANMANGIAGSFEGFVQKAKAGTLTVGDAFKTLGSAIGQAMLGAIGDTLVQMGVSDLTQGTTLLLKGKYSDAGGFLAAGAAESAAGGAIKGLAAAYLADGGLVTRPTLAMVGEAGSPEGIIPLSKLGGMGGTNLSVGTLSMNFPGVSSQMDLSGSNFQRTAARQFIQIQQYANRRTGKRNA